MATTTNYTARFESKESYSTTKVGYACLKTLFIAFGAATENYIEDHPDDAVYRAIDGRFRSTLDDAMHMASRHEGQAAAKAVFDWSPPVGKPVAPKPTQVEVTLNSASAMVLSNAIAMRLKWQIEQKFFEKDASTGALKIKFKPMTPETREIALHLVQWAKVFTPEAGTWIFEQIQGGSFDAPAGAGSSKKGKGKGKPTTTRVIATEAEKDPKTGKLRASAFTELHRLTVADHASASFKEDDDAAPIAGAGAVETRSKVATPVPRRATPVHRQAAKDGSVKRVTLSDAGEFPPLERKTTVSPKTAKAMEDLVASTTTAVAAV
jgi:hypothetical protein